MLPVAGEPLGEAAAYGDDRIFVHVRHGARDPHDAALNTLRAAGHPVFTQQFDRPSDLGALFVEWEIATALVGAKLHINPFDQPNVQEAKDRTVAILDGFAHDGKLPAEEAGIAGRRARARRAWPLVRLPAGVRRARRPSARPSSAASRAASATRSAAPRPRASGRATCIRRASSTRAARPNGVFVQLLAGEQDDEAVPGRAFGFRTLRDAQALGDAGALRGRGLPLARVSLAACEAAIERALEHIATTRTST